MTLNLRATGCHLQCGITQCYPTQMNTPRLNSNYTGQYSIYLYRGWMAGWVGLGDRLHTEMVTRQQTVTHPSTVSCLMML